MDTQRELFFENPKLLGLGRQIGPKILEAFIAHTSALEMTQLWNVLITDNSTIKTNYR